MTSEKRRKLKIAINQSILELQRNLKNWNIVLTREHFVDIIKLRSCVRLTIASDPQNGGHFGFFEIFVRASIWHQNRKGRPNLCQEKYFRGNHGISIVTACLSIAPSIYQCLLEKAFNGFISKSKISSVEMVCVRLLSIPNTNSSHVSFSMKNECLLVSGFEPGCLVSWDCCVSIYQRTYPLGHPSKSDFWPRKNRA